MSFPFLSFKAYNNIIIPAKTRIFVQYGRYTVILVYIATHLAKQVHVHMLNFVKAFPKLSFKISARV